MSAPELIRTEALGFQQQVARLQALLEASRKVHGALDLNDVLHCALEIVVKELEAHGAFLPRATLLALHPAGHTARSRCGHSVSTLVNGRNILTFASSINGVTS